MAERSLEKMSEREFRALQEAPLAMNNAKNDGMRSLPLEPGGESLEPNTLGNLTNSAGGQTSETSPDDLSDEDIPENGFVEILESDMDEDFTDGGRSAAIHSSEMSDMNSPGEIDIEDLDEQALDEVLPVDARLDPIQE